MTRERERGLDDGPAASSGASATRPCTLTAVCSASPPDTVAHYLYAGECCYAACIMDAKTVDAVAACDLAEQEAERILHAKPHGEALAKDVCEKFFVQFETLSMADAGDHAELVEEVLEEVRADVVTACQEQGTKAEVDCAMGAKTMTELNTCASKLL